ncbi:MAG: hypothetical protein ACE5NP_07545 [Anaerolineae bacterium]
MTSHSELLRGQAASATPELRVVTHGHVPSDFITNLRQEVEDCYRTLSPPALKPVELCLIDTVEALSRFLAREKEELGVGTLGEEDFLALHDAWHGLPRIVVCVERMLTVEASVRQGAIHHEVGHTVLHGSLAHYLFRLSPEVLAQTRQMGIETAVLQQVVYFVSIAVKDYVVTRLLVEHGLGESQVALALYQFEVSPEDELAWRLARTDLQAKLLYVAGQLKPLLFAWPLLPLSSLSQPISKRLEEMLAHLPAKERGRLLGLAEQIAGCLGQETGQNIAKALNLLLLNHGNQERGVGEKRND